MLARRRAGLSEPASQPLRVDLELPPRGRCSRRGEVDGDNAKKTVSIKVGFSWTEEY